MNLHEYLSEDNVLFLKDSSRKESIRRLVQKAHELGYVEDAGEFEEAVLEREAIMSTGMGLGVAVPHAKLPDVRQFFIMIGVADREVDWTSIDQKPVRIIFLIGGPSDKQKEYLTILSKLMLVVKNAAIRESVLSATTAAEVLSPFLKV